VEARTVKSTKAPTEYRIHNVTLEDYVLLSRRLVTPIYPADANLIVNLLDLHPETSNCGPDEPKLEILEAGTGHGALTLYLSRAVHAANARSRDLHNDGDEDANNHRRAIIHTIDVSPKFSTYAQAVVEGFRKGMYSRNVDFHVGDVSDWVKAAQEARGTKTFLSHAFLDLPSAENHVETVADALETDGTLIAFNPSITQIIECATKVKNLNVPLDLDRVVELGVNGGTGGREWVSCWWEDLGVSPGLTSDRT
jgi:tRNA A58 N-methylase Trm61